MLRLRRKGSEVVGLMDTLKKGFGFVLLSMGVSRPAPKPKPETKPGPKAGSAK